MTFRSRSTTALTTAALVAGAAALAAGCGGSSSDKTTGTNATTNGGAKTEFTTLTPAAKGTVANVTWAIADGEPTTIDPVKTGDLPSSTVVANMCDNLLQLQPDFSVKPGLAEKVDRPNPVTVVLHIRPNVTFWDGHPLTADDVVYSMKRNMDPSTQPVNAPVYMRVKSITKTGPLTVTVRFKAPDAVFLDGVTGVAGAIVEKAYATKQGKAFGTPRGGVMCTGAYKFDSWTSGDSIKLSANPSYWDTALRPKVQNIEFRFIADSSTLTSALLSGEVDGAYEAPVGSSTALGKSSQGTLYTGPSSASVSFGPTTDKGPAADPRVRRALDLAIDKNAFIKNILHGAGAPLKTFTPPFVYHGSPAKATFQAGYDALPDNSKPDLAKAKALIAQARPAHKTLVIATAAGNQLTLQISTIVQAAARSLGLDMKIKQLQPTEFGQLFYNPAKRAGLDFVATTGYFDVPSALTYAPLFALKVGPFNWSGYDDPTVAKELGIALTSTDPQVSAQHFVKAQAIYGPADLQVSLAVAYERLFLNKRLTGVPASFAYVSSPWAARLGAAG
jgi:peptide/nickel transport system substrate-binding protein